MVGTHAHAHSYTATDGHADDPGLANGHALAHRTDAD